MQDLYTSWLSEANYLQQARKLWSDHEGKIVDLLGDSAAKLSTVFKAKDPTGTISAAVKTFFSGMVNTNEQLKTGGIELPRLSYEQAQSVLTVVHLLSGKQVILILDALEQSPDVKKESANLHLYLDQLDQWPPCHFLLAVRAPAKNEAETEAYIEAKHFAAESARAELKPLLPMELTALAEQDRLFLWLHEVVPGTKELDADILIQMLDGFPGILRRWKDRPDIIDEEEFQALAEAAQAYRYQEVGNILEELRVNNRELLEFAIRLVMLPEYTSEEEWQPFINVILKDEKNLSILTDLRKFGLLEDDRFPCFGLTARYEFCQRYVTTELRHFCKPLVELLIISLASQIKLVDESVRPYASALDNLCELIQKKEELTFDPAYLGILSANKALLEVEISTDFLLETSVLTSNTPGIAPLISIGLSNAISYAKGERQQNLLAELRDLYQAHKDDAAVREWFAKGLFNTFNDAEGERPQNLLAELRDLFKAHEDNAAVREQYAKGLYNAFFYAEGERKLNLSAELHDLFKSHEVDIVVRELYATDLFNSICDAKSEQRWHLLAELRNLFKLHGGDAVVRDQYAKGLNNSICDAEGKQQQNLLSELRDLLKSHGDDTAVRKWFASGLNNAIYYAKSERQQNLLDELRELFKSHRNDAAVREQFAKGLFNAFLNSIGNEEVALKKELESLLLKYQDEPIMQEIKERLDSLQDQ